LLELQSTRISSDSKCGPKNSSSNEAFCGDHDNLAYNPKTLIRGLELRKEETPTMTGQILYAGEEAMSVENPRKSLIQIPRR
jgi:hypothetical protein